MRDYGTDLSSAKISARSPAPARRATGFVPCESRTPFFCLFPELEAIFHRFDEAFIAEALRDSPRLAPRDPHLLGDGCQRGGRVGLQNGEELRRALAAPDSLRASPPRSGGAAWFSVNPFQGRAQFLDLGVNSGKPIFDQAADLIGGGVHLSSLCERCRESRTNVGATCVAPREYAFPDAGDVVSGRAVVLLHARRLSVGAGRPIVCIHGVAQHGAVFQELARSLGGSALVVALDLRGHGESGREPPWDSASHAMDIIETLDELELEQVALVGHSFGGRVSATLAAAAPGRVSELVLLDPALRVPPEFALASAEVDRLDWTFASVDSAVNALLGARSSCDPRLDLVEAFAAGDLQSTPDGRLRFSFCPSSVVTCWSEMARTDPPIADLPTLIVRPVASHLRYPDQDRRYRDALGSKLTISAVPRGHNIPWESPCETAKIIDEFLGTA